jgi:Trypsin-co-occurring domain 1
MDLSQIERGSLLSVKLDESTIIFIELAKLSEIEEVGAISLLKSDAFFSGIKKFAERLRDVASSVQSSKVIVTFNVEAKIEASELFAVICRGSTSGALTIRLEWGDAAHVTA